MSKKIIFILALICTSGIHAQFTLFDTISVKIIGTYDTVYFGNSTSPDLKEYFRDNGFLKAYEKDKASYEKADTGTLIKKLYTELEVCRTKALKAVSNDPMEWYAISAIVAIEKIEMRYPSLDADYIGFPDKGYFIFYTTRTSGGIYYVRNIPKNKKFIHSVAVLDKLIRDEIKLK